MALGMTFVILCAEIDLSVGAVFALSGVVMGLTAQVNPVLGIVCGLLVGIVSGLMIGETLKAYEAYDFRKAFSVINQFCTSDLSALYVDTTKDRLYCDSSFSKFYSADAFAGVSEREYFELKTKIAEETIDHFEKWFKVDIRSHIEEIVTASPVTFARYIGTPQGDV